MTSWLVTVKMAVIEQTEELAAVLLTLGNRGKEL